MKTRKVKSKIENFKFKNLKELLQMFKNKEKLNMYIGLRFWKIREEKGYARTEVEKHLGMAYNTMPNIETKGYISILNLLQLMDFYNVSLEEVLGIEETLKEKIKAEKEKLLNLFNEDERKSLETFILYLLKLKSEGKNIEEILSSIEKIIETSPDILEIFKTLNKDDIELLSSISNEIIEKKYQEGVKK